MTTSQRVTTWYIGPGNQANEPPNPHRNRPIGPRVRKTAINDAIRNRASMHEVREFAGYVVDHITGVMDSPEVCGVGTRSFVKSILPRKTTQHNEIVSSPGPVMASR
jgi:hypothetical protein